MNRENLAKAIFTHVKNNDNGQVEKCLTRGDVNSWREIIRYENELLPLLDNVLKNCQPIYNLLQCTINSLSAFHLSALMGHNDILITFLDKDIPVDTTLQTGTTCLHLASFGGHVSTVKLLLNVYHAEAARPDKYGWTALHYASIEGNLDLIKVLVGHGVDVSVRDQDGTCAALRAKWRGHENVVSYFCKIGDEDDLLNIDDSMLKTSEDPQYARVDKIKPTGKGLKKTNSVSLDQHVPTPERQASLPAGKSRSKDQKGKMAQTLPIRFREARDSRIRRVIRNELEAAFSDYEQPIGAAGPTTSNHHDEETEVLMAGVGVKTMTRLMREEILKYRNSAINNASPKPAPLPTHEERVSYHENDVYEDHYQTLESFGVAPGLPNNSSHGASSSSSNDNNEPDIYKSFVPPPLPPRNKGYLKKEEEGGEDAWDMSALAETLAVPGQPTDMALSESIKKLSVELGGRWKMLAKALPLAPEPEFVDIRVREIEKTYLGNAEKQTMVMLIEWRLNKGKSADVDSLIVALRKCGMNDKVKIVEKITQEFTA